MYIYYVIAAIVIILSGLVLKAYKVPEARVVRVRAPDIRGLHMLRWCKL